MRLIKIEQGELMETLRSELTHRGIRNAAIVSLIGAADEFTISTMPADATKDIITEYDKPAEIVGSGEVVDGVPHIHAVMAVEGDIGLAGHVHRAIIRTHFANVYVLPLDH